MRLVRFRLDLAPGCSLGPGKIDLLEAIARRGSLTRAAASLGMSYRYAWLLVDDLKASFTEPVTAATVGGKRGGGVELTPFGRELVKRYRSAYARIESTARREFAPLMKRVRASKGAARASRATRARSIKRGR
jgi:molybdate transport system regulatory protein